ncbi:MAG: PAS domain-containing protein [Betaproteobacteria bacterium]|nr:PAS domain-containing protein [Betaproteobacteria bacterium]
MRANSATANALAFFSASSDPYYQIRVEPAHPDAAAFLVTWREHTHSRDVVIGKDIPSRPFARFLGNLMIAETIDDDTDCRIRLAGSSLRQRYKREVSGRRLSELFSPPIAADNLARLRKVRETGGAFIHAAAVMPDVAPPLYYEVLLLRALAPNETAMWNIIGIFTFAS